MAVQRGNLGVVSALIEFGADVNKPNKADGNKTPLYYARERGLHTLALLLTEKGATDTSYTGKSIQKQK
jgi:ankyrin repeat protein